MSAKVHALPVQFPDRLINPEAEMQALSMLMLDNARADIFADMGVTGDDFGEPLFGRIYDQIVTLVSAGERAGPPTLRPYFVDDPAIESLGGVGFLARLTGDTSIVTMLAPARDAARLIRSMGKRRRLYADMARLTAEVANDPERSVEALVSDVDATLSTALGQVGAAKSYTGLQAFDMTMAAIEAEASGAVPPGLAVKGFDDWNALTGNMRRGDVIILAGRPSMGKTALAISTALASARAGWGTLFISLEMAVEELMKRAITDLIFEHGTSASFDNVKAGKFSAFDRQCLADARAFLAEAPIDWHEDADLRLGRLAMLIRRFKRKMASRGRRLDVVFIDYLGLVKADGRAVKRYEEVSEVSRTIKQIARELDVAIVLLAQLNREVEKREDKRPQLSDLRDSGEIEQDADAVLFVYREQYYLERSEPDQYDKKREAWELSMQQARDRVELIAAKVRRGRIGKRVCHFFAEHQAVRGSRFFQDMQ